MEKKELIFLIKKYQKEIKEKNFSNQNSSSSITLKDKLLFKNIKPIKEKEKSNFIDYEKFIKEIEKESINNKLVISYIMDTALEENRYDIIKNIENIINN